MGGSENSTSESEIGTDLADVAGSSADGAASVYSPRRSMPTDFSISLGRSGGIDHQLRDHPTTGRDRRQAMLGFDATYTDIVDYIVRVTHRIWEEKDIGYIYDVYRHNAHVIDDSGLKYGRDRVVEETLQTVSALPDVRLFADEVIWAGDEEAGFQTSHRVFIVGNNTGPSRWGPATGRRVVTWCLADCKSVANEIYEEWVLYNTSGLLLQLGHDPFVVARGSGAAQSASIAVHGEAEHLRGQRKPQPYQGAMSGTFDIDSFLRATLHDEWNMRNLSIIDKAYSPVVRFHGPGGRELYGRGELKAFVLSLMASFPDLLHSVDDLYFMGNKRDGYLASLRWSVVGTHRGWGLYGRPTGRPARMWGISQYRIIDDQIVDEWTLFNEFELIQSLHDFELAGSFT